MVRRRNYEQGFFLTELLVSAAILALVAAAFYQEAANLLGSWHKMQSDMELNSSARYMQSVLEKDIGYESRLVTIGSDKQGKPQITCQTIYGGRSYIFSNESSGLYKQTKTTGTPGKNPLFNVNCPVTGWQVHRLADDAVQISITLQNNGRQRSFTQVVRCLNGRVEAIDGS